MRAEGYRSRPVFRLLPRAKYHAGEVGVGTGAVLFAGAIALCATATVLIAPWSATGTGLGGTDARTTTLAVAGLKFLFYDIPLSVLVFLAWSVGEIALEHCVEGREPLAPVARPAAAKAAMPPRGRASARSGPVRAASDTTTTVLEVLNGIVMKTAPKRMLMTFFYGVLDPATSTLRFASAGHLDPYVYRAREKKLEMLSSWGFPLGVKRREPFREFDVGFEPGDRLVLYSDGLIEALNDDGEPFGFERFEGVILSRGTKGADVLKQALLESVKTFTRNRPPEDDQTLVVVSFEDRQVVALRAS